MKLLFESTMEQSTKLNHTSCDVIFLWAALTLVYVIYNEYDWEVYETVCDNDMLHILPSWSHFEFYNKIFLILNASTNLVKGNMYVELMLNAWTLIEIISLLILPKCPLNFHEIHNITPSYCSCIQNAKKT